VYDSGLGQCPVDSDVDCQLVGPDGVVHLHAQLHIWQTRTSSGRVTGMVITHYDLTGGDIQ
jgi:hypothetical protein